MFISLMQSAQYLISNPIEEKSNRISEVLLASVTLGELMMPVIMIQLIPLAMVVFVVCGSRSGQYDSSNHVLVPPIHILPYD